MEQELLTIADAARYLGVSHARAGQLAKAGRIGTLYGRYYLFTQAELDVFKAQPKDKGGRPPKSDRRPLLTEASPA